jgi:hypothetical protein
MLIAGGSPARVVTTASWHIDAVGGRPPHLNGVPADVIKIEAFGADRPLVPSAGAEPQNRRAWLVAK